MTWTYVAKGHYSKPNGNGGTIHVAGGAVYITHPTKATADITGAKAKRYIASATGRPKSRAPTKPVARTKKAKKSFLASIKKGAKRVVAGAKPVIAGAKPVATTALEYGGRVAAVGEMVVASTAAAERRVLTPPSTKRAPAKKKQAKKKPAKKKPAKKKPAVKKHREQTLKEFMGY